MAVGRGKGKRKRKSKVKKTRKRRDWAKLRKRYVEGPWDTITAFARYEGIKPALVRQHAAPQPAADGNPADHGWKADRDDYLGSSPGRLQMTRLVQLRKAKERASADAVTEIERLQEEERKLANIYRTAELTWLRKVMPVKDPATGKLTRPKFEPQNFSEAIRGITFASQMHRAIDSGADRTVKHVHTGHVAVDFRAELRVALGVEVSFKGPHWDLARTAVIYGIEQERRLAAGTKGSPIDCKYAVQQSLSRPLAVP